MVGHQPWEQKIQGSIAVFPGWVISVTWKLLLQWLSYCSKHFWCEQLVKEVQLTSIWYVQMCVNCSSYCEFLWWINRQSTMFAYSTHSDHDHLHPNHHCCQLLKSSVWKLLTSLTSMSEPAAASQSATSSAQKSKNRLSSESLKRSVLKTGSAFLQLNFQKLSLSLCVQRHGGSSRSLILLLFTRFLWDCMEISLYGSNEVYQSQPDVLGHFCPWSCP